MTAQDGCELYIKCCTCKCRFINNDEHIKCDFGYNRLNERYKSCAKCRAKRRQRLGRLKQEAEDNNGDIIHCNRCYKNKPADEFRCPNGKSYNACYDCLKKRYG